jgi:hypothetical protein
MESERVASVGLGLVQELSAVFLMACETKVSRLVILGLGSLQKLVANEAIAPEPIPKLIQFLKLVRGILSATRHVSTVDCWLAPRASTRCIAHSTLHPLQSAAV